MHRTIAYAGVKHFVIDATIQDKYCFVGPKQQSFKTIPNLLNFYRYLLCIIYDCRNNSYFISYFTRVNPITWAGQEVLLLPVGQEDDFQSSTLSIFQGLYSDDTDAIQELTMM